MIGAFTKIFALGHRSIRDIFNGEVEITEKLDGSQLGFGLINGELVIRSKGRVIHDYNTTQDGLFRPAIDHIVSIQHLLVEGTRFYGETLAKPKHNKLVYDRVPLNHIALFAAFDAQGDPFNYQGLCDLAGVLGVEVVSLIFRGTATPEDIPAMLRNVSSLGGTPIEGVVVKNLNQTVSFGDVYFPIACDKYVSEAFKEKMNVSKVRGNHWEQYKEAFRTEARWEKAVQHLRERGELLGAPQDIGSLMKEVNQDILAEEIDDIRDTLWKIFGKELMRNSTRGLPEWYKEQLLKGEIVV